MHFHCEGDSMKVSVLVEITIKAAQQALSIDASNVPDSGTIDVAYSGFFLGVGGVGPYSFAVESGALPDGLELASDGTIDGTPTTEGVFDFEVSCTDSQGTVARANVSGNMRGKKPANRR